MSSKSKKTNKLRPATVTAIFAGAVVMACRQRLGFVIPVELIMELIQYILENADCFQNVQAKDAAQRVNYIGWWDFYYVKRCARYFCRRHSVPNYRAADVAGVLCDEVLSMSDDKAAAIFGEVKG